MYQILCSAQYYASVITKLNPLSSMIYQPETQIFAVWFYDKVVAYILSIYNETLVAHTQESEDWRIL